MTQEQFKGYGAENISEIAAFARPYLEHRIDLYKKYARKLNENQFMGEGDAGKIVVAFEYYIVNMVQGYLGGKSPMYSVSRPSDYTLSKNERGIIQKTSNKIREAFTGKKPRYSDEQKKAYVDSFSEAIEYIRRYNDDAATYVEIVHDYLITTAAYIYVYENEDNEIVYTRFDSKQTAAVYDYATPPNMIGIVRMWKEKDMSGNDIDVIELIDDSLRRKFVDRVPQEPEELHWNDVPCVAFENPDGIAVFEPALETISAYETNLGNIRSMTKYNDEAKLVFIGYRYENDLTKKDEDGKPWEYRKDDRCYNVGDILCLYLWNKGIGDYEGFSIKRRVTYILRGPAFGIPEGYCIMTREKVQQEEASGEKIKRGEY